MLKEILQNPKAVFWAVIIHILIIVVMLLSFHFSENEQGLPTATPVSIIDSNTLANTKDSTPPTPNAMPQPSNIELEAAQQKARLLEQQAVDSALQKNEAIRQEMLATKAAEQKRQFAQQESQAEQQRIQKQQQLEAANKQKQADARKAAQKQQAQEEQRKAKEQHQQAHADRKAEEKKQKKEQERKRLAAEKSAETKRQKQEADRRQAKAEKAAAAKRKKQEEERQRAKAEKKATEKAAEKKETERKQAEARKAAEEKARAAEQERKAKAAASAANNARVKQGKNLWARRVIAYMNQCWNRPERTSGGWSAVVNLQISRSLYIRRASIRNCDGSQEFCQSIARAIDRCYDKRLPSPPEPEYFDSEINMTFKK